MSVLRYLLLFALCWGGLARAAAPTGQAATVDRIAAVVNDDVIALSEVYELGNEFVGQRCPDLADSCVTDAELEVLDALIRRTLIHQELVKLQLDVTAAEVDQAIDRTAQSYQLPDRAALKAEIEATGKRWDQYRDEMFEYLRDQNFKGHVLAPRITISDDEVQDLYQKTSRKVTKPVVKVSGFGVVVQPGATPESEAQQLAQLTGVVDDLNSQKETWAEAVRKYDSNFASSLAGQFEPGSLVEPLASVVFNAPVGVVQPPVKMSNENGSVFLVVRVEEKTEKSEVAPFEEIKEELKNQVFQQKLQDAEEEWYQRARREAAVNVKLKAG